jgi:AbrB family looped-hinge helix DNA binding protein
MSDSPENVSVRVPIGPRGRVTIPVALRKAADLSEGETVILSVEGPGRLTIESVAVVIDRLRAAVPSDWRERSADEG